MVVGDLARVQISCSTAGIPRSPVRLKLTLALPGSAPRSYDWPWMASFQTEPILAGAPGVFYVNVLLERPGVATYVWRTPVAGEERIVRGQFSVGK